MTEPRPPERATPAPPLGGRSAGRARASLGVPRGERGAAPDRALNPAPDPAPGLPPGAEHARLAEDAARRANWKRWGPYLADRQWGTVREDYSAGGDAWGSFPHDHARSRAYRWGEDGLLGFSDRQGRLCLAVALWNERDPILKERLFGLTGPEGNHGEDVKECYWHLDGTPTHSWMAALYRYPMVEFPYAELVSENARRGLHGLEHELTDTSAFARERYFDVTVEYAKGSPDDVLVRWRVENRGPEAATLHVLPTLWFRNTWSWGRTGEEHGPRPSITKLDAHAVRAVHHSLGDYCLAFEPASDGTVPTLLFTDNESNLARLHGAPNPVPHVKDGFHDHVVHGDATSVSFDGPGTKVAAHYRLVVPAGGTVVVRARLRAGTSAPELGAALDAIFAARLREADEFHGALVHPSLGADERLLPRRAFAGLLWTKQFYHYVVSHWLEGDPLQPEPPAERREGRNVEWPHLYNRDVLSMPDKWEYPWYAAWDLAFHMIPFARLDPTFAKQQLELLLREWYMHPNGQIPAYEWNFGDVNPPVHAWAVWRVYKIAGPPGGRDQQFLKSCFHKLLLNFTWWVNRKDAHGNPREPRSARATPAAAPEFRVPLGLPGVPPNAFSLIHGAARGPRLHLYLYGARERLRSSADCSGQGGSRRVAYERTPARDFGPGHAPWALANVRHH